MSKIVVRVGSDHTAAPIFETGGVITPTAKQWLRFEGDGGEDVFLHQATIPARPFLAPAAHEREGAAVKAFEQSLAASIERILRG